MECRIVAPSELEKLSRLSLSLGNIPFIPGKSVASILVDGEEILGFAAVTSAWHAAGSWVNENHRLQGHTYKLRKCLEAELKNLGVANYFSIPNTNFEKTLFSKYGPTLERIVQIKRLS